MRPLHEYTSPYVISIAIKQYQLTQVTHGYTRTFRCVIRTVSDSRGHASGCTHTIVEAFFLMFFEKQNIRVLFQQMRFLYLLRLSSFFLSFFFRFLISFLVICALRHERLEFSPCGQLLSANVCPYFLYFFLRASRNHVCRPRCLPGSARTNSL